MTGARERGVLFETMAFRWKADRTIGRLSWFARQGLPLQLPSLLPYRTVWLRSGSETADCTPLTLAHVPFELSMAACVLVGRTHFRGRFRRITTDVRNWGSSRWR